MLPAAVDSFSDASSRDSAPTRECTVSLARRASLGSTASPCIHSDLGPSARAMNLENRYGLRPGFRGIRAFDAVACTAARDCAITGVAAPENFALL
jgi:hypothetical protein